MKAIINGLIVNEGEVKQQTILINGNQIVDILPSDFIFEDKNIEIIDAFGYHIFPGLIDDQVHFREPGLTHKGDLHTESRAAVAGGITSFMEMPNTVPQALTQSLLMDKYNRASEVSLANYSFYMGVSNNNVDEVLATDIKNVCGVKIFMGSSTGDMLVDNEQTLHKLFKEVKTIIATHCEDEQIIKYNLQLAKQTYGDLIPPTMHAVIRNEKACYASSSKAVSLAKQYGTHLHVLHISTAKELGLFDNSISLENKHITAEACIHHLWFSDKDYIEKGNFIKWNPAVKTLKDQQAIFEAVLNNTIDVIATDHAPHTLEEKLNPYLQAPSGGPLVQHALQAMLDKHEQGKISLTAIAEKMSHNLAIRFKINKRGYIRKGYFADLVIVDLKKEYKVSTDNILYKCKWSPFEGHTFKSSIIQTYVNGNCVFAKGKIIESGIGMSLTFNR